jgi:hypothetical protein
LYRPVGRLQLQDLLDEWIVTGWQSRPHDGLHDPHAPARTLSPNEAYAAAVAAAGYLPLTLTGADYQKAAGDRTPQPLLIPSAGSGRVWRCWLRPPLSWVLSVCCSPTKWERRPQRRPRRAPRRGTGQVQSDGLKHSPPFGDVPAGR